MSILFMLILVAGVMYFLAYTAMFFLSLFFGAKNAAAFGRRIYLSRWVKKNRAALDKDRALQNLIKKEFEVLLAMWMETGGKIVRQWMRGNFTASSSLNNFNKAMNRQFSITMNRNDAFQQWNDTCQSMFSIILAKEKKAAGPDRALPEGAWLAYIEMRMREEAIPHFENELMACDTTDKLYKWIKDNLRPLYTAQGWVFSPIFDRYRQRYPEIIHWKFHSFKSWFMYEHEIRVPDIRKRKFSLDFPKVG